MKSDKEMNMEHTWALKITRTLLRTWT
jgi:hypothetical protein